MRAEKGRDDRLDKKSSKSYSSRCDSEIKPDYATGVSKMKSDEIDISREMKREINK